MSFVLDIADLYKEHLALPIAFRVVRTGPSDIDRNVRTAMREAFSEKKLLRQIVADIVYILGEQKMTQDNIDGRNHLWAGFHQNVSGGTQYGL